MLRVGLTGGIAAGKSVVSAALGKRGAAVIDADVLAREAVSAGSPALRAIVERFGDRVLARDGSLDRAALGRIVFADDEARRELEGIVHPEVRRRATELERQLSPDTVVVHVIPLLVETGQDRDFDLVVVVDVPVDVQLQRLIRRGGLSESEAVTRIAAQASRQARLAAADVVIDNSGSPEMTDRQIDARWAELTSVAGPQPERARRPASSPDR